MFRQKNKNIVYLAKLLWFAPIILLFWLVRQNSVPSGILEASYSFQKNATDFEEESPYIFHLEPKGRLRTRSFEDGYWMQSWYAEPIYFYLKMPRLFNKANLEIIYRNQHNIPFRLAYEKGQTSYDWEFIKVNTSTELENGWQKDTFSLDLNSIKITNNKLRFMLSATTMKNSDQVIDLRKVKIILTD